MQKATMLMTTLAVGLAAGLAGPHGALAKGKPGGGGGGEGTPADPEIAYVDYGLNQGDTLMVMDADGGNQTALVSDIYSAGNTTSWAPDRSRIYFEGRIDDSQGLYVYDFTTESVDQVFAGGAYYVACSPELDASGNYLVAFYGPPDTGASGGDVWVYDPATDSAQNLTAGLRGSHYGRTETYPTWSPDGDRIAWRWNEFGQVVVDGQTRLQATAAGLEVYSFTRDGTIGGVTIGTRDDVVTVEASASVDPNEIGFVWLDWSRTAGSDIIVYADYIESEEQNDLFTIDISTGVVTRLTATPNVREFSPSWSPDDSLIAFSRKGSGRESKRSGVYTITATGGNLTALGAKTGVEPDWAR